MSNLVKFSEKKSILVTFSQKVSIYSKIWKNFECGQIVEKFDFVQNFRKNLIFLENFEKFHFGQIFE